MCRPWLAHRNYQSKTEVEGLGEKTKRDDMEPEGMSALAKEKKMNRDAPPGTPV